MWIIPTACSARRLTGLNKAFLTAEAAEYAEQTKLKAPVALEDHRNVILAVLISLRP